ALEDGAAQRPAVLLEQEEPAVPARVLERVPRERDAQLAEALLHVGLVEIAPERLPVLRLGRDADVETEPLHPADVVLAGGAAAPVARDHLLDRAVGREPEGQPARHAGAADEAVDRPRGLPEREVGAAGEAARRGRHPERGDLVDHLLDGRRGEERPGPVARGELVGREQADEWIAAAASASLEAAQRVADTGETDESPRRLRRRLDRGPHAGGEERRDL